MKRTAVMTLGVILLAGCAPKMGKDIFVEVDPHVRWENSSTEIVLGVLSLLGASVEKEPIRIGGNVKIINKWYGAITLKSLMYALSEDETILASGKANIDPLKGFSIDAHAEKTLPLQLVIDPKMMSINRLIAMAQHKRKVMLKGEALIEVWGFEKRYVFEKDATKLIEKALKGGV